MTLVIHNGSKIIYIENIGLTFAAGDVCVVNGIPAPEDRPGYVPQLIYDETLGLTYTYNKIEEPIAQADTNSETEGRIKELETQLELANQAITELIEKTEVTNTDTTEG